MSAPTYLGCHAELRTKDLVVALMPELADGWERLPNDLAYRLVTAEECLRSLGPHRGRFAIGFRGVSGVDMDAGITTTGDERLSAWTLTIQPSAEDGGKQAEGKVS